MEKLCRASMGYTVFGLASGVYWRELTRYFNAVDPHTTQLRVLHSHCFTLGTFFFLIVLLLEKQFKLSQQKNYKKFYAAYNSGLGVTLLMMIVHGTLTVMGKDQNSRLVSWAAGVGHMLMTVGFYYFYNVLSKAIKGATGDDKK